MMGSMRVLLAIDGSASALLARDVVATLRWPAGTVIDLVAAYQVPVPRSAAGSTANTAIDAEDALRGELAEQLHAAVEPLLDRGLEGERHVVRGRAADVILQAAANLNTDLIVTGSRGRGPLSSMILGSVASEVASHAPCSVLVARAAQVSRVLVATDGSPSANAIPEWLRDAGILRDVPADAVAVWIPEAPAFELMVRLYTLGDERLAAMRRELREQSRAAAEAMAERLTAIGIPTTPLVRGGDPAHEILAAATEQGSDLIVAGSRGLEGLERLLLGSVARNVLLHARSSVLIARAAVTPADQ
jgi:nucleotide-binding universal stress UspA family protein